MLYNTPQTPILIIEAPMLWFQRDKVLVAEWIHFTLFGITLPTVKLEVYTF